MVPGPDTEVAGAAVFAPAPELTVTLERFDDREELHLHAGGQGFWIARLLHVLGVDTTICGSFGGETGQVVQRLIEDSGVRVVPVAVTAPNGGYVHDRRKGTREEVGSQDPSPLSRHELDDLYSAALATGLGSVVCVLGGPDPAAPPVPTDLYRRLALDLRANGTIVVADLSGEPREAVLRAGVDVLKTSDEDLADDGLLAEGADDHAVSATMRELAGREGGARHLVVTRGDRPALALTDGRLLAITGPRLDAVDPTGAGDSMTAGITAALVRGRPFPDALRLGLAAAALNVTRRGLASGDRDAITAIADRVQIEAADTAGAQR